MIRNLYKTKNMINGFVILKPEFLKLTDQLLNLLRENNWKVIQKSKVKLTKEQTEELYNPHKGKDFYEPLCDYMSSGECLCCSCYKDCSNPIEEMNLLKSKFRNTWSKDDMKNTIHSSDSLSNVERESKICLI